MWWFNTNVKLAVGNQNMYSFNWNIRSVKAHKLNLRLCAFEKSVEGKPKKVTSLVVIEHVLASWKRKRVRSRKWSKKSPQPLYHLAKLKKKFLSINVKKILCLILELLKYQLYVRTSKQSTLLWLLCQVLQKSHKITPGRYREMINNGAYRI